MVAEALIGIEGTQGIRGFTMVSSTLVKNTPGTWMSLHSSTELGLGLDRCRFDEEDRSSLEFVQIAPRTDCCSTLAS